MTGFPFTPGARGRVSADYAAQYPDPLVVRQGDVLALGERGSEWPGWVWCTAASGKSGWVPAGFIERRGESGRMRRDYSARELDVRAGELLTLHELEAGWYWVATQAGETGWVPARNVEMIRTE